MRFRSTEMVYLCTRDMAVLTRWEEAIAGRECHFIESLAEIKEFRQDEAVVLLDLDSCGDELDGRSATEKSGCLLMAFEKVPDIQTGKRLLALGIKAYANTWILPIHLHSAIDTVKEGGIWLYPEFVHALVKEVNPKEKTSEESPLFNKFTSRERELATLLLEGLSNAQIAGRLQISERTVKAHITNILKKSHVSDRLSFVLLIKG